MKVNVLPADIKEVKISVMKCNGRKVHRITIPMAVVRRYDLKAGETILIAYLCRNNEDIREIPEIP